MSAPSPAPALANAWAASAPPAPPAQVLTGEARADVAVVGGGFTGCAAALHLAERGTRVALIEAQEIGHGGSGRNGGQVVPGLKRAHEDVARIFGADWAERLGPLADGMAVRVFALIDKHAIACDPRPRCGQLRAAHADRALRTLEGLARDFRKRGQAVDLVSPEDCERLIGTPKGFYKGGILDRRAGAVNPLAYVRGLAAAAQRHGATLYVRSPVVAIERAGRQWRVATESGAVLADQVILGTGAYTDSLWPGLRRSFVPVQSAILATAPLSENVRATIMPGGVVASDTRKLNNYYRLDPRGRFLMGGRGPVRDDVNPGTLASLRRAVLARFPVLAEARLDFAWAGRIDMTTDEMARVSKLGEGVWAVLGYNGRGVAIGTTLGAVVANKALGTPDAALDYPATPLAPIPFHALRLPAVAAAMAWFRVKDALGFAGR